MSNDDLDRKLGELERTHRLYKTSLGKQSKTRAWAVWLLIGALLSVCHRIISCQKRGDLVGIFLLGRLAVEYSEQIRFFANPQIKIAAIQDWWKRYGTPWHDVDISEIEYRLFRGLKGERKIERYIHTSKRKTPKGVDFSQTQTSREMINLLSLYSHPSLNLTNMLFQSDKNDERVEEYNYKGEDRTESMTTPHIPNGVLSLAHHSIEIAEYLYRAAN